MGAQPDPSPQPVVLHDAVVGGLRPDPELALRGVQAALGQAHAVARHMRVHAEHAAADVVRLAVEARN